jgi:hypothetical protein
MPAPGAVSPERTTVLGASTIVAGTTASFTIQAKDTAGRHYTGTDLEWCVHVEHCKWGLLGENDSEVAALRLQRAVGRFIRGVREKTRENVFRRRAATRRASLSGGTNVDKGGSGGGGGGGGGGAEPSGPNAVDVMKGGLGFGGPGACESCRVVEKGDGEFHCHFSLNGAGTYRVLVGLVRTRPGATVTSEPIVTEFRKVGLIGPTLLAGVTVVPADPHYRQCRASGQVLSSTLLGMPAEFTVVIRDAFGNRVPLAQQQAVRTDLEASISTPGDLTVEDVEVVDTEGGSAEEGGGTGSHVMRFRTSRIGRHNITILIFGRPIHGSPFMVDVLAVDDGCVVLEGAETGGEAGGDDLSKYMGLSRR